MRSMLTVLLFLTLATPALAVVEIDWVTVGDPGNACDVQPQGCFGSVSDFYRISKFEVTNAQYAEFLNAVAATDTNAVYNTNMGGGLSGIGITRSGSSGSYVYTSIAGSEDMPVGFVTFWNATRFANWLHNGQPTGAQDNTTTEDGAYTLTPTGISDNTVTRNSGAEVFVTNEDEWYKAAYYDTGAMIYFDYPAGSDTKTTCTTPGATANTANCNGAVDSETDVGSYTGASSPSGTFDQGGNFNEWNDAIVDGSFRVVRGGDWFNGSGAFEASRRFLDPPTLEFSDLGFRVAGVPEPGTGLLQLTAMLVVAGLRRLRA
jgi:sulfatase modifying factor 1